jgi:acyl-CoA thioester hydrolase
VLDVHCQYLKTLRAEDIAYVRAKVSLLTKTRIHLAYEVVNEQGEVCAKGQTHHAYVDMDGNRPVNLAKRAPDLWTLLQTLPRHD